MKKWENELNRVFSKEEVKKHEMLTTIKEMQIKTTLKFHLTPVTKAVIKNTTTNVRMQKEKEPLYTVGGNVN
jgi:hypothetical protein